MPHIALIDLLETTLISFILSGVGWNVAAGYGFVHPAQLPVSIPLTTLFLIAVLTFDRIETTAGV